MQLSPSLEAGLDWVPTASSPAVTLTSSGGIVTATINGTTSPLAALRFTAVSGASATVESGQTLTVPTSTISVAAPTSPEVNATLPVEGGSLTFTGDSFFLSLEMSLPGSEGTVAAAIDCTAAGKAPTDCTCPAGEACTCSSASAPPLGVHTQCSTELHDVGTAGGTEGGDTTVTIAEQNGALTMTLGGGPNPVATGTVDLTPTSAATATIAGGQSFGGQVAPPSNSCTPGGDLWTPPEWPIAVESGSLTTDGQWLTVALAGTSPCASAERLTILCPVRAP
jgi:hypothetical protein